MRGLSRLRLGLRSGLRSRRPGLRLPPDFPRNLLAMQTLFYTVQAVSGTYLIVYFGSIGFSKAQIGLMTSVATLAVLLTQPLWGYASDRAADGRAVLSALFLGSGALMFGFLASVGYVVLLTLYTLYSIFYNPIPPVMDSLTLETLEREKSSFDYGHVRIGGTVGYCVTVLLIGRLLTVSYLPMFYISAALCFGTFFAVRTLGAVKLRGKRAKLSFRVLLVNKRIFCYLFLSLVYAFGSMGFYNFYSLHFTSAIADNSWLGVLMFVCAISEVPFWLISRKAVRRFGYERMMLLAITVTAVRWLLLYLLTNVWLILATNLVHGFCFVTINYSLLTYINDNIPEELRATGQTMNNLFVMVFSRIIGGVAFGAYSERFGVANLQLLLSVFTFAGGLVFVVWTRSLNRAERAV